MRECIIVYIILLVTPLSYLVLIENESKELKKKLYDLIPPLHHRVTGCRLVGGFNPMLWTLQTLARSASLCHINIYMAKAMDWNSLPVFQGESE